MLNRILLAYIAYILCVAASEKQTGHNYACPEGETLLENECSFSLCSTDSPGICTKMVWWITTNDASTVKGQYLLSEWSDSLQECIAETTTWMKKCNKCWCIKDVGQICQHKDCKIAEPSDESSQTERASRNDLISKLRSHAP